MWSTIKTSVEVKSNVLYLFSYIYSDFGVAKNIFYPEWPLPNHTQSDIEMKKNWKLFFLHSLIWLFLNFVPHWK